MNNINIKELCLGAMLLSLLIIGSKITIPLGVISLTMQLPVVFLILFLTRKRMAILIIATYLLMGLMGIPVFSTGGGFAYIYKPSFGFILGFLVAAIVIPNQLNKGWLVLINILIAISAVYIFGLTYMYMILNYYMNKDVSVIYVINAGATPFILKDLICAYIASIIAFRVRSTVMVGFYEKSLS